MLDLKLAKSAGNEVSITMTLDDVPLYVLVLTCFVWLRLSNDLATQNTYLPAEFWLWRQSLSN